MTTRQQKYIYNLYQQDFEIFAISLLCLPFVNLQEYQGAFRFQGLLLWSLLLLLCTFDFGKTKA